MDYIVPALIFIIFLSAFIKNVPVYDSMCEGAHDGIFVIVKILPSMICVMSAAAMLRASGAMELIVNTLSPVTHKIGIPAGVVPMALMRPVSGSGSLGMLAENINTYGADSAEGLISSIIMGSTETTFYTLAVYFGSVGVKDTGIAAVSAVIGDIAGVAAASLVVKYIIF